MDNWVERIALRIAAWVLERRRQRFITAQVTFGDYGVVPDGWTAKVMHKTPGEAIDPLGVMETIGWKVIPPNKRPMIPCQLRGDDE